jgi:hypothetical protein
LIPDDKGESKDLNLIYESDSPHEAAEDAIQDFWDEGVRKYNIVSVEEYKGGEV